MSRLPPAALADATVPDAPLTLALLRIEASRARLRTAMLPPADSAASDGGPGFALPRRWRAMWRSFTRSGPLATVAKTAASFVGSWWRRQPWHSTTEWAGRALLAEVQPLVRRHPLMAVAVGASLGAALVSVRPWRWRALNRHVRPMGGHLMRWTIAQLSQVPVQMALAALLAQFVGDRARGQAGTQEAKTAAAEPQQASAAPQDPQKPQDPHNPQAPQAAPESQAS